MKEPVCQNPTRQNIDIDEHPLCHDYDRMYGTATAGLIGKWTERFKLK